MDARIYLSAPDIGEDERVFIQRALDSGWVAPLGPDVEAFEREVSSYVQAPEAVALSSGTAAIHLALATLDIGPESEVVVPTFTFGATAFPVTYVGASPIFVDAEKAGWGLDPSLLDDLLTQRQKVGRLPHAVISVDLFGQTADYESIVKICAQFDLPLIEDAAEAIGASHTEGMAGTLGKIGIFSFNGNKIMTTSGGGMLVTQDETPRRTCSLSRNSGPATTPVVRTS